MGNAEFRMVLGTEKLRRRPMRGWRLRNSNDSLATVRKRSAAPGFSAAMRSPVSRKSSQTGDLTSKFIAGEHYALRPPNPQLSVRKGFVRLSCFQPVCLRPRRR